jgi:hypothetical protein
MLIAFTLGVPAAAFQTIQKISSVARASSGQKTFDACVGSSSPSTKHDESEVKIASEVIKYLLWKRHSPHSTVNCIDVDTVQRAESRCIPRSGVCRGGKEK